MTSINSILCMAKHRGMIHNTMASADSTCHLCLQDGKTRIGKYEKCSYRHTMPQASPGQERKTGSSLRGLQPGVATNPHHHKQQTPVGSPGNRTHGPRPGVARDHPPPPAADPSQEWPGTATKKSEQEWRGTSHHHKRRTPARGGGEPHLGPSARSGKGPTTAHTNHTHTNTSRKPQPRETGAGNKRPPKYHAHTHKQTSARGRHTHTAPPPTQIPQTHKTHKSTTTTRNCPRHKHTQYRTPPTPKKQPTAASGPQPGVAGSCNQDPQPGVARDHTPPPRADPSQEWRGIAPGALSQEWRENTHHHR